MITPEFILWKGPVLRITWLYFSCLSYFRPILIIFQLKLCSVATSFLWKECIFWKIVMNFGIIFFSVRMGTGTPITAQMDCFLTPETKFATGLGMWLSVVGVIHQPIHHQPQLHPLNHLIIVSIQSTKKSNLHHTRSTAPTCVWSCAVHLLGLAPEQHNSAVLASCWRHCVW